MVPAKKTLYKAQLNNYTSTLKKLDQYGANIQHELKHISECKTPPDAE